VTAPNVRVGNGRVHRARTVILGTVVTLCGRTLNGAAETTDHVNCGACWRAR
jgi:hypothetical protein